MRWTLSLPEPQFTDLGLTWKFEYRGYACMLVATDRSLRLWMDNAWLEPSRVLLHNELENDWVFLSQPLCLEHMILARPESAAPLLALNAERILRRYADVKEGLAPPGFATQ